MDINLVNSHVIMQFRKKSNRIEIELNYRKRKIERGKKQTYQLIQKDKVIIF